MRAKVPGVILMVAFLIAAKGCSTKLCGCVQFDTQVRFNFVGQNGNSLLNPDQPRSVEEEDIELVFVEHGVEIPANSHFDIVHNRSSNRYYLLLEPNLEADTQMPVAYLTFNESDRDTVKVEIVEDADLTKVTMVWYNGVLRWDSRQDRDQNPARYIEIEKELNN